MGSGSLLVQYILHTINKLTLGIVPQHIKACRPNINLYADSKSCNLFFTDFTTLADLLEHLLKLLLHINKVG